MRIIEIVKQTQQALSLNPANTLQMNPTEQAQQTKRLLKFAFASAAVCLLVMEPSIANATTGDTGGTATDNLTNAANSILGLLTGTLGKAVATIAVVVMGLMAMFGKLEWERAFKVILGIAIVFGAASIITLIGGSTAITSI